MINDFQQEIMNRKLSLKEDIKRTGGNCSRMLLILGISVYVIGFAIMLGIKIRARILGIDIASNDETNTILGISSNAYKFLLGYLPCIIGDIIVIIIAMKTTKVKIKKDIFSRNKSPKMFIFLGTVSCIGIGMISSVIYAIYSTILNIKGITIPQPDFNFPTQSVYLILFLIYACLLGPILEEIIFRGFILKSMQKYGNLTAIIVSSILFSMFHLNLVQFVNPVLMGIVLAFIAIKSKSIVPSIIAHIFNNSITFTLLGISLLKMPLIESIFESIYLLVGISALALFVTKYRKDFIEVIKENTRILKTYEKVRYAFSGAWGLTYIAFYVIFVVGFMIATNAMKIQNIMGFL
ncbi:MAG: CPBP family intramembrane metalloprotease [Clostridium sp.]|uniref:CPBP family intramembrane glutamic endopeptidase n=1 Tax=Clostridium sp. TaxID=1506 RepID=UPI0025BA70C5|nr:CPBP family glutamic-type intramembrane protease [Clostridium sp.]MCE5220927.1 CPBP family intramembrane metalloprotease [Clostridium sp.]